MEFIRKGDLVAPNRGFPSRYMGGVTPWKKTWRHNKKTESERRARANPPSRDNSRTVRCQGERVMCQGPNGEGSSSTSTAVSSSPFVLSRTTHDNRTFPFVSPTLDHKPLNVTMEDGSIVLASRSQGQKIERGPWASVTKDLAFDVTLRSVNGDRHGVMSPGALFVDNDVPREGAKSQKERKMKVETVAPLLLLCRW